MTFWTCEKSNKSENSEPWFNRLGSGFSLLIFFLLLGLSCLVGAWNPVHGAGVLDDNYDSFQWFRQAIYRYDVRKDEASTVHALKLAIRLNPENFDARGFALWLSRTAKVSGLDDVLKITFPPGKATSPKTRRWYDNALDSFEKGQYDQAIYCLEKARSVEPSYAAISLLERQVRGEVAFEFFRRHYEEKRYSPQQTVTTSRTVDFNEKLVNAILQSDVAYNPERARDWLGLARYYLVTMKDVDKAIKLAKVAEKYAPESIAINAFRVEITQFQDQQKAEKEKETELKEAEKLAKDKESEEISRKKRETNVRETIFKDTGTEVKIGRNEFFEIDFWKETLEADLRETAEEIKLGDIRRPTLKANEVREYVRLHFLKGQEKYAKGFHQEALLEYEKSYLRVLRYNPEDIRAHFNLVLIYNKMNERRAALEQFMKLLNVIRENRHRMNENEEFRRIDETVYCWLLATVIQSATLGYNNSDRKPMSRQTFVVSKLVSAGLLNFGDKPRKLNIHLSGNVTEEQDVEFTVHGVKCPQRGRYHLNKHNQVECSVHSLSPLITQTYEWDRFAK